MIRVGIGHDTHRLVEGRPLILGGVRIEHPLGLLGHSDADVVMHAVADALLGAAALGDIGEIFPDTDPEWLGLDGSRLLAEVVARRAPALADVGLHSGWAGLYEMTPDHNALIGESDEVSRFVYATGFSIGGTLALRIACERPELVAAAASVEGTMPDAPCAPALPTPVWLVRGGEDADLRIEDPGVSRKHIEIRVEEPQDEHAGPRITVHDLGSTNGVSVNGKRVDKAVLADGATIRIGNTTMSLRIKGG